MLSLLQSYFIKKMKNVTLQVRLIPLYIYPLSLYCKKRVLPSAFYSASLTMEAAISFPLVIFAMVILLSPIKIMNQHRKVQMSLEQSCEELSQYGYFYDRIDMNKNNLLERGAVLNTVYGNIKSRIDSKICSDISLSRSKVLEDGETLDLIIDYKVKLPIPIFHLPKINQVSRSYKRIWIGENADRDGAVGKEFDERVVYMGRNGTRYHISRECHYLSNNLKEVSRTDIDELRNEGGAKYSACNRCGKSATEKVYIMPNGRHYHTSTECSSILAYVREAFLSEVYHLGPCSYCSEGASKLEYSLN